MDAEHEFIELLIENVKKHKCLYDKKDGFYFNRNTKEKAWDEVSDACDRSVGDCKNRWKLLRERFGKEIKRMETPTGTGLAYLGEWKYMQGLMFLREYLGPRRTFGKFETQIDDSIVNQSNNWSEDSIQDVLTTSAPPEKKSKPSLENLCQKFGEAIEKLEQSVCSTSYYSTPENDNPLDDVFFKIASCLMKELPDAVKEEFQANMLQELYRLRREHKVVI